MAPIDPQLQSLFDEITDANDVDEIVSSKRAEGLYLEFKSKENNTVAAPSDTDKSGLAEQLSAFANADGGVLIFGVKTDKKDGPDFADSTKPITKHREFLRRLQSYVIDATMPPIDGVVCKPIDITPELGYVKILVPPSNRPPHMVSKEKIYYRRSSDGNRRMDHIEIADMLGSRSRPDLKINLKLKSLDGTVGREMIEINLINQGRTSAKYAGFVLCFSSGAVKQARSYPPLTDQSSGSPGKRCFAYDHPSGSVIHPNGLYYAAGQIDLVRVTQDTPVNVNVVLFADGMQTRNIAHDLVPGEFQS